MTSIAESRVAGPGSAGYPPGRLRSALLLALLGGGAALTPAPWRVLWAAIPAAVAASVLGGWRFGARALALPGLLAVLVPVLGGGARLWAWWIPAASLTGVWMGLGEERGSPAGARAWMLLPALLLAAALPWAPGYRGLADAVERELQLGDAQTIELVRQVGYSGERLEGIQHTVQDNARLRRAALPHVLPTLLFVWVAALIAAGRKLAARGAGELHWPNLAPAPLLEWRLPDGALWTFLAGLGLLVGPWTAWAPTAWTLLLNSGLGFCVQGIAVVESLLLARGVPPSIIVLTMVFVFAFALPVFVLATVAVGLSDVWLDYRRLEPAEDGTRI